LQEGVSTDSKKVSFTVGTEEVVETLMSNRSWMNYFLSASLKGIEMPTLSITLDYFSEASTLYLGCDRHCIDGSYHLPFLPSSCCHHYHHHQQQSNFIAFRTEDIL
jgi:hypothetical protein